MVAKEQRQWAQAEQRCQQALAITIEFNDRYSQASTYHQLGRVAEEQRQWAQAREYFLTALQTYMDYRDEHNLSIVLASLARLYQAAHDATLAAAAGAVLGVPAAEAQALMEAAIHE